MLTKISSTTSSKRRMKRTPKFKTEPKQIEAEPLKELITPSIDIDHEVRLPHTIAESLGIDAHEDQKRIAQLRQERRDLYDLLHGHEDDEDDCTYHDDLEDDDTLVKLDIWSAVAKWFRVTYSFNILNRNSHASVVMSILK